MNTSNKWRSQTEADRRSAITCARREHGPLTNALSRPIAREWVARLSACCHCRRNSTSGFAGACRTSSTLTSSRLAIRNVHAGRSTGCRLNKRLGGQEVSKRAKGRWKSCTSACFHLPNHLVGLVRLHGDDIIREPCPSRSKLLDINVLDWSDHGPD